MLRKNLLITWLNDANGVRQRSIGLLSVLLAVLMILSACAEAPGEAPETISPPAIIASPSPAAEEEALPSPPAEEAASPSPMAEEEASPSPTAEEGNMVEVALTEFEVEMPSSLPAGPTTFNVMNSGTIVHNFEIEGQGIEEEFDENLQPGETRTMEVDLQPGTYEVYCPVGNHREQGMLLELTVTE